MRILSAVMLVANHIFLTTGFVFMLVETVNGSATWTKAALLVVTYLVASLGITIGWHRYGVHRAFKFNGICGRWIIRPVVLASGCWAWQSHYLWWCAVHQEHHQSSDDHSDPHGPVKTFLQFWWVQLGLWVPFARPNVRQFADRRGCDWLERLIGTPIVYILLGPIAGMSVAYVVAGLSGIAWYLAGVFCAWHITQSVNSVTHLGGLFTRPVMRPIAWILTLTRPHHVTGGQDSSVNSWLIGILGCGEGWHNNHHHKPASAKLGGPWWQLDIGWYCICLMRVMRWVKDVKVADFR